MQQLAGQSVTKNYGTYFFQLAGNDDPFTVTVVLAVCQLLGVLTTIDGVQFHHMDIDEIPKNFVSIPVKLIANEIEYKTRMVAGSVSVKVWSSGDLIPDAFPRPGKTTTRPRVRTTRETKKKANKVARLRKFASRLICLSGKESSGSASKESPDKVTAVNELSDTVSKPQAPQGELKARLDSIQPVSGWWMYELKIG